MTFDPKSIKPFADLRGAILRGADLTGADLRNANLRNAYLGGAYFGGAYLGGANLRNADLTGADLAGADLRGADLTGAYLTDADLTGANLTDADLRNANLRNANLTGAKLSGFQIPQEGDLIAWKKLDSHVLAKLLIPASAKRTGSLVGRKCRASVAKVLEIVGGDGKEGYGLHDGTIYRVGRLVKPDSYDSDVRVECTHGIHFFLSREEAEAYR